DLHCAQPGRQVLAGDRAGRWRRSGGAALCPAAVHAGAGAGSNGCHVQAFRLAGQGNGWESNSTGNLGKEGNMATRAQGLAILRQALEDQRADFHHGQWETIDALVNRRSRQLVVQRTGWGKSAVYFIATRLLRDAGSGPSLVIS